MKLQEKIKNIRRNIIKAGNIPFGAHFGGCLSCADVLAYLYENTSILENKDCFILSKGHCALALYAVLAEYGIIENEELMSFCKNGGDFATHLEMNKCKGIELTSGSLGMGLSYGIGKAVAFKESSDGKVYVLCGNGEMNEGSIWEAVMFASQNKLDNLVLIIDNNKMQLDGESYKIITIDFENVFQSFGWNVKAIDGNNLNEIDEALQSITKNSKPTVIISNTTKGKGVSFMENSGKWHHATLSEDDYKKAIEELEE